MLSLQAIAYGDGFQAVSSLFCTGAILLESCSHHFCLFGARPSSKGPWVLHKPLSIEYGIADLISIDPSIGLTACGLMYRNFAVKCQREKQVHGIGIISSGRIESKCCSLLCISKDLASPFVSDCQLKAPGIQQRSATVSLNVLSQGEIIPRRKFFSDSCGTGWGQG